MADNLGTLGFGSGLALGGNANVAIHVLQHGQDQRQAAIEREQTRKAKENEKAFAKLDDFNIKDPSKYTQKFLPIAQQAHVDFMNKVYDAYKKNPDNWTNAVPQLQVELQQKYNMAQQQSAQQRAYEDSQKTGNFAESPILEKYYNSNFGKTDMAPEEATQLHFQGYDRNPADGSLIGHAAPIYDPNKTVKDFQSNGANYGQDAFRTVNIPGTMRSYDVKENVANPAAVNTTMMNVVGNDKIRSSYASKHSAELAKMFPMGVTPQNQDLYNDAIDQKILADHIGIAQPKGETLSGYNRSYAPGTAAEKKKKFDWSSDNTQYSSDKFVFSARELPPDETKALTGINDKSLFVSISTTDPKDNPVITWTQPTTVTTTHHEMKGGVATGKTTKESSTTNKTVDGVLNGVYVNPKNGEKWISITKVSKQPDPTGNSMSLVKEEKPVLLPFTKLNIGKIEDNYGRQKLDEILQHVQKNTSIGIGGGVVSTSKSSSSGSTTTYKHSATNHANGQKIFSNDGSTWVDAKGKPIQ